MEELQLGEEMKHEKLHELKGLGQDEENQEDIKKGHQLGGRGSNKKGKTILRKGHQDGD